MQPHFAAALALIVAGCGGGGGGPVGPGPLALTTSTITSNPPSVIYSVTGTGDSAAEGHAVVTGTITKQVLAALVVGTTACDWNAQDFESLLFNTTVHNATYRFYGHRDDAANAILAEGERLGDGVDILWDAPFRVAPTTLAVGDSFDLLSDPQGARLGIVVGSAGVRVTISKGSWTVTGIDDVQVPLGWYECYVIASHEERYDGGTGASTTDDRLDYVRPEIGVVYSVLDRTVTTGTDIATGHLVLEATGTIAPP